MKKSLCMKWPAWFLAGFLSLSLQAQVAINADGADPHASAMLDISATDKGLLIPRLTDDQMNQIGTPAVGLLVFNKDKNAFYFYDGQNWLTASADNMGNHKATQDLAMQGHWIINDTEGKGIFIYPNGWVGINTDTTPPPAMLHLKGEDPDIQLSLDADSQYNLIEIRYVYNDTMRTFTYFDKRNMNYYIRQLVDTSDLTQGKIIFQTSGGQAMVIQQNKNVGINQVAPLFRLDVNGKIRHGKELYIYSSESSSGYRRWAMFQEGDQYGDNVYLAAGGLTAIGGGEGVSALRNEFSGRGAPEYLYLLSDRQGDNEAIKFVTSLQEGWNARVEAATILGDGRIGIHNNAPQRRLDVNGTIRAAGSDAAWTSNHWGRSIEMEQADAILWQKGDDGVARGIGSSDNGTLFVIRSNVNDDSEAATYDVVVDKEGRVGFGIRVPTATVHIKDVLRLEPRSAAPSPAYEGDIYYDSQSKKLKYYDGENWKTLKIE